MNKMVDDLFFKDGPTDPEGPLLDPIFLRLRNGEDDEISQKEKEQLSEFASDLARQVCKKEFDPEDIDLFVRILYFLGNYPQYKNASWLFRSMTNEFCIEIEKFTRP